MASFATDNPGDAAADSLKIRLRQGLIVFGIALALNLAGNGRVSLWDRDEPRYATSVREMKASGDYIVPTFNSEPRYHKPVLIYWLMALSTSLLGDNPFGARLVSSLAGAVTCLICLSLGRRLIGPKAGYLGALALMCAPIMVIESKLATTDATLTLFLVGCQFCLWELSQRESKRLAIGFWVLLALAFLTKGPIGPAILLVAGLGSWLCGGPTAYLKRLHWKLGTAVALAIAGPWFLAVGIRTDWEFFREAIGTHILKRAVSTLEDHGGFPGYYLLATLAAFHPWSSLLPAGILAAWSRRKSNPALGFLIGWVVGPLILLELIKTKLIHYYLPSIPGCALLIAWLLVQVDRDVVNLRRWPLGRVATGLFVGVGLACSVGTLAGAFTAPLAVGLPCALIAVLIGVGTLFGFDAIHRGATLRAAHGLVVVWSVVMFVVGVWLAPAADPYRISQRAGERLRDLVKHEGVVPVLFEYKEPGMIYAMEQSAHQYRDITSVYDLIRRDGAVATLLTKKELLQFRKHGKFEMENLETIHGFNVNKGETQALSLTLLRGPRVDADLVRAGQETLVK